MTLELPRNALVSNRHEPLVLVETGDPKEHLIVVEGSSSALAVGVIRLEDSGAFCYPHGPVHPRLGPFPTVEKTLEACRELQRTERCYDSCCQHLS